MHCCRKCLDAVAEIRGGVEAPQLAGCVEFYQENGCVLIMARVSGLPESETGCADLYFIPIHAISERRIADRPEMLYVHRQCRDRSRG